MPDSPVHHLLFVCTGNTCRSPMAEYLMRHRLGPDVIWQIRSAGVFAADGMPASREAVAALAELDMDGSSHRSQMLTRELVEQATLIAVMTEGHKMQILQQIPEAKDKVFRLMEFADAASDLDVHDPVGGPISVYRSARDQIDSALVDLILYMKEHWGLSEPAT